MLIGTMKAIKNSHRKSMLQLLERKKNSKQKSNAFNLIDRNVRANGNYLMFHQITTTNAGRYYCTASNPDGNVTKTAEVIVSHNEIPDRTVQGRVQEVLEGETVSLGCSEETTPGATVSDSMLDFTNLINQNSKT